jgi:hypothetical protein
MSNPPHLRFLTLNISPNSSNILSSFPELEEVEAPLHFFLSSVTDHSSFPVVRTIRIAGTLECRSTMDPNAHMKLFNMDGVQNMEIRSMEPQHASTLAIFMGRFPKLACLELWEHSVDPIFEAFHLMLGRNNALSISMTTIVIPSYSGDGRSLYSFISRNSPRFASSQENSAEADSSGDERPHSDVPSLCPALRRVKLRVQVLGISEITSQQAFSLHHASVL